MGSTATGTVNVAAQSGGAFGTIVGSGVAGVRAAAMASGAFGAIAGSGGVAALASIGANAQFGPLVSVARLVANDDDDLYLRVVS